MLKLNILQFVNLMLQKFTMRRQILTFCISNSVKHEFNVKYCIIKNIKKNKHYLCQNLIRFHYDTRQKSL